MYVTDQHYYKVRARGLKGWRDFDRVRLEISVGQSYHEGKKLSAILDWAQDNFSKIHLIVGDTTQRYNLMIGGMSHAESLAYADRLGRDWLHRNRQLLSSIPSLHVHRCDDWRRSPEFEETLEQVKALYDENTQFHTAVKNEIENGFIRWVRRGVYNEKDKETHKIYSHLYLLEEAAILALAYRDLPGVSAYPGSFGEMWQMFVDADIPGAPIGLKNAHSVCLGFETRNRMHQDQSEPLAA